MNAPRALFLDRDGVINVDHGFVYRQDQFEFVDGIFDLCRYAQSHGYLLIVVTNQAGIGRGIYTEDDFYKVSDWMCEEFRKRQVDIKKVYFCPYHPEHGLGDYRRKSSLRKPEPGMILAAAEEFGLDLVGSILIGDKKSDIQAGFAAGVGSNILYLPSASISTENVIRDLRDAIQLLG